MANAGDVLENPFTRQNLPFGRTTADTGGELLEVESSWASAGQEPPSTTTPTRRSVRARAVWQTRPALRTEAFFEMVWGLAQAAKDGKSPDRDEAAAMMREFENEFRLGRPDPG
jgi:hypothetical protein